MIDKGLDPKEIGRQFTPEGQQRSESAQAARDALPQPALTQPERAHPAEPPQRVETNANAAAVPTPVAPASTTTPEYKSTFVEHDNGVPIHPNS